MRLRPHQLDPGPVVDGDYVLTVTGGVVVGLAPIGPTPPVPLTTIGPDGPGILFAADGHIIYAEAP